MVDIGFIIPAHQFVGLLRFHHEADSTTSVAVGCTASGCTAVMRLLSQSLDFLVFRRNAILMLLSVNIIVSMNENEESRSSVLKCPMIQRFGSQNKHLTNHIEWITTPLN